jgi:hypothetical protein
VVLDFENYLESMFIPENKKTNRDYIKSKLSYYYLSFYDSQLYILYRSEKKSLDPITQNVYLKDYLPDFFKK